MDARQFLTQFGHIAKAPNGIAKLRELILVLAMQGRLSNKEISDKNVDYNLADIDQLKKDLILRGEILREKFIPQITDSEKLYRIPSHWRWIKFGNITQHNTGKTLDRGRNSGPKRQCITTSNVYWGYFDLTDLKHVPIEDRELKKFTVTKGDLLICEGGDAGRSAIWNFDHDVCFQNHIHRVRFYAHVNPWFALRFFEMLSITSQINFYRKGVGISSISGTALSSIPFPLTSIEEQNRIISKIDELMEVCDRLQEQLDKKSKVQKQLRIAILGAIKSDLNFFEFQQNWQRLYINFHHLFTQPKEVDELRSLVLELAFKGLLTLQDKKVTEEDLLQISLRKQKLLREKTIKRVTAIIDFPGLEEIKGNIPNHWKWCRLNDISNVVRGGSPRPAKDPRFYGGSIPFLKVADITRSKGMFVEGFSSTITEAGLSKTREIKTRTVLLTNSGATLGVPAICEFRTTINDGIAAFMELDKAVNPEYLHFYLKSKTQWLQDIASRGQGQPNLNTDIIKALWFPLPPICEQEKIVSVIKNSMVLCDVFEKKLRDANTVITKLITATVTALTGINNLEEDLPLKAPQTKLIAPIKLGSKKPDVKDNAPLTALILHAGGEIQARELWQLFGVNIDVFYAQLKNEIIHGWICEPKIATMQLEDSQVEKK